MCINCNDTITLLLNCNGYRDTQSFFYDMPIGSYTDCDVRPPCGLLGNQSNLNDRDNIASFYAPSRHEAQLLWFHHGFVEYRFSNQVLRDHTLKALTISFEACSAASNWRKDWPSDITVSVNDVELGIWCCPSDFGGRQGRFTPEWWLPSSTQYGLLKRWRVDGSGSWLDDEQISSVTLDDLRLTDKPYISVKIGVKPDAVHQGGINLFGEHFGDHHQAIVMRLDCKEI